MVAEALDDIPAELQEKLDNVYLVVEQWPSREILTKMGLKHRNALLALYEGVPITRRGHSYGGVLPDRITIFQRPIESLCRTEAELVERITKAVVHEIAHYFGIGEARLRQLGY